MVSKMQKLWIIIHRMYVQFKKKELSKIIETIKTNDVHANCIIILCKEILAWWILFWYATWICFKKSLKKQKKRLYM